jgi:type IX secretion system PorP/SprF family membrane protein
MKKWFLIVVTTLMAGMQVYAQQRPHYTQYILNQYIINPAITGIENYTDVKASHRLQWVGLLDAPVTTYFSIHGPIGKSDSRSTATSFNKDRYNPRGRTYWDEYTASKPHHGIGLQIINDRTGPLNSFSAFGTYAYHLGLSVRTNLAAGIGVGIASNSINTEKLQFYNGSVDPAVYGSGVINRIRFDMNAGIYLYSADYFVGISAQQVAPSKIDFSEAYIRPQTGKTVPHFFATAGYRMMLGDDFNFIPSVMVKYVQPTPVQIEVNGKLQYLDFLWVGGGFRQNDGMSAMAGINISNVFNVGYSYDYTSSRLNSYTRGTHEILIGFLIGNKYDDRCPKNVW